MQFLRKYIIHSRKGFSFLEVIIVVAIATSILLAVTGLNSNIGLLNNLVNQGLQSKSDVSQALQIMTSEVRSAEPSENGAYPVIAAGTSSFMFYSDINKDGTAEQVRYFLASSTIYKGVVESTGTPAVYPTSSEAISTLFGNITIPASSTLFTYYNSLYTGSEAPLTQPVDVSQVRLIRMGFYTTAQSNKTIGRSYNGITVDIRNLRSN